MLARPVGRIWPCLQAAQVSSIWTGYTRVSVFMAVLETVDLT
jgi:hypothetical protein